MLAFKILDKKNRQGKEKNTPEVCQWFKLDFSVWAMTCGLKKRPLSVCAKAGEQLGSNFARD